MGENSGFNCIKWLLMVFNFLFFCMGMGLLGVGIYLNVERGDWKDVADFDYISTANVAIASGVIVAIVSFLGCCGAVMENRKMLLGFFLALLICFILELAAGVASYVKRSDIEEKLHDQLKSRIPDRYWVEKDTIGKAMDKIQEHFHCCGIDGYSDWKSAKYNAVPQSCCLPNKSCNSTMTVDDIASIVNVSNEGCFTAVKDFLEDNLLWVGICGVIFAVFQILGMIFSIVLFCHYKGETKVV